MPFRWAHAAVAALCLNQAAASPVKSSGPVEVLETRHHQGSSFADNARSLWGLRRDLATAGLRQRGLGDTDVYKTNGTLDLSWSDATLYSLGPATVSCASCYVKGTAHASLTVEGDFNFTQALSEFHAQFLPEVKNITEEIWHDLEDWADYVYTNITGTVEDEVVEFFNDGDLDDFDICWDCYAFPSFNESFDITLTDIPETTLRLQFDELELYMLLDVALEADETYKIDLYPKTWAQPAGIEVGDQLVGVIISLQLILQMNAEVDISTGVHVKFEDGLAMEIAITDGDFEFLPVTVNTTGVTFDATLRLGVTAGLNMSEDLGDVIKMGAGASALVYADIAHFNTNITLPESTELTPRDPGSDSGSGSDNSCLMPIVESYELGLGAQAGAFVQFNNDTWGPTPNTSIQIFYTTLFTACAVTRVPPATNPTSASSDTTMAALLAKRDDLTTSPASTTYTITNVICKSPGLRDCPASLQSTVQVTSDRTVNVIVSKGVAAVFPPTTTAGSGVSTVAFGNGSQKVRGSSGSPVSYVPPTSTASGSGSSATGGGGVGGAVAGEAKKVYGGLSEKNKKLVIGLCAGLGGALIGLAGLGVWLCLKKRQSNKQGMMDSNVEESQGLDASQPFLGESEPKAKWQQTQVSISLSDPMTPRHD